MALMPPLQTDKPVWPAAIGFLAVLACAIVFRWYENRIFVWTFAVISWGSLIAWLWSVFWPKPK